MTADLGFYFLLLCCLASTYAAIGSFFAGRFAHRALFESTRYAATVASFCAWCASIILWYSLFERDFSIAYIFKNSSLDLPHLYTFTAFWSSLEGSHMLWTLLLSTFATIAIWTYTKANEHIIPYVNGALQAILAWMSWLAFSYSDVFARLLPMPVNGQGMNALLQNPYMAIHPPTLFTGYTALSIPFAYSVAALVYGDVTEGWLKTVRRWTVFAWCALTAGVFLGGRWAYVELGWAGYWAWDPVENSSFMPWLFATALMHSLLVQDKLGALKRLSLISAFLGFFLSFFGTFITRSGVITSVHSFAESPIGPAYLTFLATLMGAALILYIFRADSILPAESQKTWGVSKESALVVTQFLLMSFAAIIFIGTLYPIITDALTGQKTSVQAPYFNAFAPWVGLGFVLAISIGNLMRYNSTKITGGAKLQVTSLLVAILPTILFCYFGDVWQTPKPFSLGAQVVGSYLCFWSISNLTADFYARFKDVKFSVHTMWKFNSAFSGAYLAHVGMMIAVLGFLGNYRGQSQEVTLKQGEKKSVLGYEFLFSGMNFRQVENQKLFEAPLTVSKDTESFQIFPARSQYPTKPELFNEIAVESQFWRDIYVVIAEFDRTKGETVTLQVHINPTVRLVWLSCFVMVLGGLIALTDKHRGNRSRDALLPTWEML